MTILEFESKRDLVKALVGRDGKHCYLCNKPFSNNNRPTIDHIKPLSKGGSWHFDNLALAHLACNQDKADREFVNGVLEPKQRRLSYQQRKRLRRVAIDTFCDLCNNGRLLLENEHCPECDRTPGGTTVPMYLWRQPKECDHSDTACWLCFVGIVERESALERLITG